MRKEQKKYGKDFGPTSEEMTRQFEEEQKKEKREHQGLPKELKNIPKKK